MKKLILIISALFLFTGCDNEPEVSTEPVTVATAQDSIKNYQGSFISAGKAAVLKGDKFIYQVKMDSAALALQKTLVNYKSENEAVIPVEVKGKVADNSVAGEYSQVIQIKEIVEIFAEKQEENTQEKN